MLVQFRAKSFVFLEQKMPLRLWYANACIGYLDHEVALVTCQTQLDHAAWSVFHRVAQQVKQDQPKLDIVRHELAKCAGCDDPCLQPPRFGAKFDDRHALVDQGSDVDPMHVDGRPKRLYSRVVQHHIYHVTHMLQHLVISAT